MGLKKELNFLDATAVGVGAIIGAGIFVVLGIAIGYAGPSIVVSIAIAGVVASFTAFSFAELSSAIPREGGAYEYAFTVISPSVGFVVGCLWLFAMTVAGVAVTLGLASYFVAIFPMFPVRAVAVAAAITLTGLNLAGIKQSTAVNTALVIVKIAILCLFIAVGFFHIKPQNFAQFSPNGVLGILQGAGFVFFAYLGFGRIAILGEEVKNPERTVPLSVLSALTVSVAVYLLTGFVAVGLQNYQLLAQSSAPLAEAARVTGSVTLVEAVSFGALMATVTVLLTNLIGLSRVTFAMARNGQLPKSIAKVSSRLGTPYVSVLSIGAVLTALTYALDLKQASAITSFSILCVHLTVNISAIGLRRKMPSRAKFRTPVYPLIPSLGIVSCIILMLFLPRESWLATSAVIVISAALYVLVTKRPARFKPPEH